MTIAPLRVPPRLASAKRAPVDTEAVVTAPLSERAALPWAHYYPATWAIGLGFTFWPVLAALVTPRVIKGRHEVEGVLALATAALLMVSIPLGVLAGLGGGSRVVGALANISVWVAVAGLLVITRTAHARRYLYRSLLALGAINGLVAGVSWLMYPTDFVLPVLGRLAGALPPGMGVFVDNTIAYASWDGGMVTRTTGMMGQPTWSGCIGAATILLAVAMWKRPEVMSRRWLVVSAALASVALYFSYSRAAVIATVLALGVAAIVAMVKRMPSVGILLILLAITGILIAIYHANALQVLFDDVNDRRAGSLDARNAIYADTVSLIQAHPFPLLGYGIKANRADSALNIATHSTYLGLVYRGGIAAALTGLAFLAIPAVRAMARGLAWAVGLPVFLVTFMILEDFDAGYLVPLFAVAAICLSREHLGADADEISGRATTGDDAASSTPPAAVRQDARYVKSYRPRAYRPVRASPAKSAAVKPAAGRAAATRGTAVDPMPKRPAKTVDR